ncbi:MAG: protein glxC [Alphaproteobacteria bacterium]|nr:protein glxC [Alphaproteobacteria bacterium]
MSELDVAALGLRAVNERLQSVGPESNERVFLLRNPMGQHALACGLDAEIEVTIDGHAGYYCGGMNSRAAITVRGHCGVGVAENMMSGCVRVTGNASQSAGASGQGGLLVIAGDASARCGISMKGIDIVVGGSVGHMSAFMAQAGRLVVCGDAGDNLGDSIYEARLYVRGKVASLGADCVEKPMRPEHLAELDALLRTAGVGADAADFRRYGSARQLYHFHIDHAGEY